MFSLMMSAIDAVFDFVFTAFKKVLWTVFVTAVVASIVTVTLIVLGYNVIV